MTNLNQSLTEGKRLNFQRVFIYNILIIFFLLMVYSLSAQMMAPDGWNQFRGGMRSGLISDIELPDTWPDSGPELVWTKDVGSGFPEVATTREMAFIFSSDSLDGGYEYLAALDIKTGKEFWKTTIDSLWIEIDGWGNGPRSTPAIDDNKIYCVSGFGKFSALELKTGKKLWTRDLPAELGSKIPRWGFTASPIAIDNVVILETGGTENRTYCAFDKTTGDVVWNKGFHRESYCSPAIAEIDGQTNIVFAGDTMLYSFDSQGNELWAFRMPLRSPTAMPVFIAPNKFFLSSVSSTGSFIIEVNDNDPKEVFTSTTMQNNWSSSCYIDGYLYGFSRAKLQCVSVETGEMKWGKRGYGKGSLIIVGNKLMVLSDQGKLIIGEATPDAYTEIISFQALEGKSWTAPSYSNGKLFVRNLSTMSCYQLSK